MPELSAISTSPDANGGVGKAIKHESADKHVSGEAVYVDDRMDFDNQLHLAVGKSSIARGKILTLDLDAVRAADGVVAVITATDIPGLVDIGPVFPGDPLLAEGEVLFMGQALFAVAAQSHEQARKAARLAVVEYEEWGAVLDPQQAADSGYFVRPPHTQKRGDAGAAIAAARHSLQGSLKVGGQEHFYLEGQISSVVPTEDGGMEVYCSSQNSSEIATLVAKVLGVPENKIVVDIRRMGGAFGGKETQASIAACLSAVIARLTGRPAKMRMSRSDDMEMTGKRHPFVNHFQIGFDDNGQIKGAQVTLNGDAGCSPDLSDAIVDRAMYHIDNAYYLDQALITGNRCRTDKVSNTAFRGFGGPQGVITIESIIDDIAWHLGKDPLEVRKINLYGKGERNVTHYHQTVEHNVLPELIEQLEASSGYWQRRQEVTEFNAHNRVLKKGLALTPVKFGISFTVQYLNQAGALLHIYTDGSIHLNHGGTEMGQGLFTKVAQIVAEQFQVDIDHIQVSACRTDKVPNASPTAASSGTDLNGQAAKAAASKIKSRLIEFAAQHFEVANRDVVFRGNRVYIGDKSVSFAEMAGLAYTNRISLSATGYYRTPKIFYDREKAAGRPFFYFANGAAVSEVIVDTMTGEYKVLQVDILHDVGKSLNPVIDIGQIEGAYIQGLGWLTTEELVWNEKGSLLSNGPATYKIPAISDTPIKFNVALLEDSPNEEASIYHSKAVGEPPLMLAISAWCAIRDAVASLSDYKVSPTLEAPATPENVLKAIASMQGVNEK